MPTNITTASWTTPQEWTSTETLTASQVNSLSKDVGFLYAKPWALIYLSSGTLSMSANAYSNTHDVDGVFVFGGGGTTTVASRSSSSGVGSFGISNGFTAPSGLVGMYRVTAQMMVSNVSTAHVRMLAVLYNGGTVVSYVPGTWESCGTDHNATSTINFILPMNVAMTPFGSSAVTGISFLGQSTSASTPSVSAVDLGGNNPATTNKVLNTFASIEYLGTSVTNF